MLSSIQQTDKVEIFFSLMCDKQILSHSMNLIVGLYDNKILAKPLTGEICLCRKLRNKYFLRREQSASSIGYSCDVPLFVDMLTLFSCLNLLRKLFFCRQIQSSKSHNAPNSRLPLESIVRMDSMNRFTLRTDPFERQLR